jgi:8-oxo-dGTP pyrophosphatase MutT (NUDIX family)
MLVRKEDRRERRRLLHFPKGRHNGALSEDETALREVREETGYKAEILGAVPGVFQGGMGQNVYFLMRPIGPVGEHDTETQSVRWVDPAEEAELIQQTTNEFGRRRDLKVLEAALAAYRSLGQGFSKR